MTTEIEFDLNVLSDALACLGMKEEARVEILDLLRRAEIASSKPNFSEDVRWPLIVALLRDAGTHKVKLADGLIFEVGLDSRIERALLLSPLAFPDHIWEPQTTKLLVALAEGATNVIVGGAYIGDQVLPLARIMSLCGTVHAFEPMRKVFARLRTNVALNGITNVEPRRLGLWDRSGVTLRLDGHLALASSSAVTADMDDLPDDVVESITISDYVCAEKLPNIDLIMLDTEGGEEKALLGATEFLSRPLGNAPNIVFEIHRNFVDWSDGLERTSVVAMLISYGYQVFAIRDVHGNQPMTGKAIEIIPADRVYLEGPPHGFNMLAIKDISLVDELGLHVIESVSPKLIEDREPALYHPRGGFG